jgi:hypothetical protein
MRKIFINRRFAFGRYFPHFFIADVLIYSTLGFIIYAIVR